ncbi:MAG: HdeA/HdeB family chaperone [Pseudomonadota bacterium]
MNKYLILSMLSLVFVAFSPLSHTASAPEQNSIIDISATTCRDLLRAEGEEEQEIMIYFHGYVSGIQGQTLVNINTFMEASSKITDRCIDKPDSQLLKVFQSIRAK